MSIVLIVGNLSSIYDAQRQYLNMANKTSKESL